MRAFTVIFFALMALIAAQDTVVVEENETAEVESAESLDLDAMLAEDDDAFTAAAEEDTVPNEIPESTAANESVTANTEEDQAILDEPEQIGPFIDLLGTHLYSLEMIDETQAQLTPQYTNEALKGKKVVGLYFSADWW